MLFLHRFARRGAIAEFTTYDQLAAELGVAPRQMVRTVERIIRFEFARWADDGCEILEVATEVGPPHRPPAVEPPSGPSPTCEPPDQAPARETPPSVSRAPTGPDPDLTSCASSQVTTLCRRRPYE